MPQLFITGKTLHSYTFITDAAEALYILSQHDEAFRQTWHMPTASPALAGNDFVRMIADATNNSHKV